MAGIWSWTCAAIGHQRSKTQARRYGATVMSRCRCCDERMVRIRKGAWRLVTAEEEAAIIRDGRLPQPPLAETALGKA